MSHSLTRESKRTHVDSSTEAFFFAEIGRPRHKHKGGGLQVFAANAVYTHHNGAMGYTNLPDQKPWSPELAARYPSTA
jgi:hypothetical protein